MGEAGVVVGRVVHDTAGGPYQPLGTAAGDAVGVDVALVVGAAFLFGKFRVCGGKSAGYML